MYLKGCEYGQLPIDLAEARYILWALYIGRNESQELFDSLSIF